MNVYISTSCLKGGRNLFHVLDIYRQNNIQYVELGSAHNYDSNVDKIYTYDFHYLVHNYFPPVQEPFVLNLASQNHKIVAKSLALAKKSILLCAKLNIPFYTVHPGYLQDPDLSFKFNPQRKIISYESGFRTFCESIVRLNNFALKQKVKLLVENNIIYTQEFGNISHFVMLYTQQEFIRLFKVVNSQNLGILLDLGHLNVGSYRLNFDKYEFIESLKGYVMALHLSGNDGAIDSHGNIDRDSWMLDVIKKQLPNATRIFEARNLTIEEIIQNKQLLEKI